MKKILTLLAIAAGTTLGYTQGTVSFTINSAAYAGYTNTAAYGSGLSGTQGKTSITPNGYYYALLTAAYGGAAPSASPLSSSWTSVATGNNSVSALFPGGIVGGTVTLGVAAGTDVYVEVVGWSAGLGTTWQTVSTELATGNWAANGYFGVSGLGYVATGNVVVNGIASPATSVWSGTGIPGQTVMYAVSPVPEPATVALIGLGGLGLAMIRRRK
jgi:hypothetical protein